MKQKPPPGRRPGPANGSSPQRKAPQTAGPRQDAAQQIQPGAARRHSAERLMRIERRKARSRAIAMSIFVLAIMLVTVLMIITVMKQAKPQPRLIFIQNGELAHTIRSSGLIIREEIVFNSPAAGLLKPLVTEGSRVARGQKLALVIPADKEDQLKALQKCERDIVDLQTELMSAGKGAGAEAVFHESGASLAAVVNLVRGDVAKSDMTNLSAYSASIEVILEQRTAKLMSIDFKDSRLDTLIQTRNSLESELGLAAGTLVCEKPGIVSFRLDGLETVLNDAMADTITAAEIGQYTSQTAGASTENKAVKQDQSVMRITASLSQHLVFLLPDTDPGLFKEESMTRIQIPADGVSIENCRVMRSEASGSSTLLVLLTDRKVEWLSDRRIVQAELTLSVTKGLKVPVGALMDKNQATGEATVMIIVKGYTRTCKVKVIDSDREYAIISAIESETNKPVVSTILVANPDSVEPGEFIGN
jgi:multidrug efflux pump subunit AcrA (membrane-fusion protein)